LPEILSYHQNFHPIISNQRHEKDSNIRYQTGSKNTVIANRFFVFSFSLIVCLCAVRYRLSWPSRQLLSARKYIVSYRIVLRDDKKKTKKCMLIDKLLSLFLENFSLRIE